jgi:hypothetical protein
MPAEFSRHVRVQGTRARERRVPSTTRTASSDTPVLAVVPAFPVDMALATGIEAPSAAIAEPGQLDDTHRRRIGRGLWRCSWSSSVPHPGARRAGPTPAHRPARHRLHPDRGHSPRRRRLGPALRRLPAHQLSAPTGHRVGSASAACESWVRRWTSVTRIWSVKTNSCLRHAPAARRRSPPRRSCSADSRRACHTGANSAIKPPRCAREVPVKAGWDKVARAHFAPLGPSLGRAGALNSDHRWQSLTAPPQVTALIDEATAGQRPGASLPEERNKRR